MQPMDIITPDGESIGYRIKLQRKYRDMTQEELALIIGTNARQVWRWENGDHIPRADMLAVIAQALGTSTDYLLGIQARWNIENLSHDELTVIHKLRGGDKLGAINYISRRKPHEKKYQVQEDEDGIDIEKGTDQLYTRSAFDPD